MAFCEGFGFRVHDVEIGTHAGNGGVRLETVKPIASELSTERLTLRLWRPSDDEPFAAMNADPRVREHYPGVLSREESDASAARIRAHFGRHGFGLWAIEAKSAPGFLGYAGIMHPSFAAPCGPCVEIGWRLACAEWGKGYATEAARAIVAIAFERTSLEEIVSFATVGNVRSQRVMQKLGMTRDPAEDFDHPLLGGHRLARHVLYRLKKK